MHIAHYTYAFAFEEDAGKHENAHTKTMHTIIYTHVHTVLAVKVNKCAG